MGKNIIFANAAKAAKVAFSNMQKAFDGEAKKLGLKTEQDVTAIVDEVRQEMWDRLYSDNT